MVRRFILNPNRCALSEGQPFRKTEDALFGAESLLRIRPADIAADVNAVAWLEATDAVGLYRKIVLLRRSDSYL